MCISLLLQWQFTARKYLKPQKYLSLKASVALLWYTHTSSHNILHSLYGYLGTSVNVKRMRTLIRSVYGTLDARPYHNISHDDSWDGREKHWKKEWDSLAGSGMVSQRWTNGRHLSGYLLMLMFLFINYRDAPESDINSCTDGHRYFPYSDWGKNM